ncbi:unnamed protein product [Bursaphelenchus okinawaensis]|uniref:EGF-like domain-containing protein n=1 Tax=Bursaphelenchus okinawaensis TaxID=465554 RepID=A0A811LNU2_9BILA|nr:unnamed protein product [Bursaphelenchus okinawaensis]CAG9126384.1 unnamed protein product [Bursaphelenchus okinawaensis]
MLLRAFCILSLVVGLTLADTHYDIRVHLKTICKQDLYLASHEQTYDDVYKRLTLKFQEVLGTPDVSLNLYDFAIAGTELNLPTVMFHAELTLKNDVKRDVIIEKVLASGELVLPYIAPIKTPSAPSLFNTRLSSYFELEVTDCVNGGVLLPNATCVCPSYFTGTNCSRIVCEHQGVPIRGECYCPPGYVGKHCETLPILPVSKSSFDFSNKSFVLVLHNSLTMAQKMNDIATYLYELKDKTEVLSQYFDFVLVTFAKDGYSLIHTVHQAQNIDRFIDYFVGTSVVNADARQPVLTQTVHALLHEGFVLPKSNVFVVSDALASDSFSTSNREDNTNPENLLLKSTLHWQHSIHVILADKSKNEPHPSNPGASLDALKRASHRSNGEFVRLPYAKNTVSTALKIIVEAQHKANTVALAREKTDASGQLQLSIKENGYVYLIVYGDVTVIAGAVQLSPEFSTNQFSLYKVESNRSSIKFTSNNNSTWGYRAVAKSDSAVSTAFTSEELTEATANYATQGLPNMAVVRPLNLDVDTITTKMLSTDSNVIAETQYNKRVIDSNFPYVAKKTVECTPGPLLLQVEIKTKSGDNFVSLIPSFCFEPVHHQTNDIPDCHNGRYDQSTQTCICKPFYSGKYCEDVKCANYGEVNPFPGNGQNLCSCEPGFEGQFCERMTCAEQSPFPESHNRTLIVILQRTFSQAIYNAPIRDGINNVLKKANNFDEFVLTTYANTLKDKQQIVKTQYYNNSAEFINDLDAKNIQYLMSKPGDQGSLDAIKQTLSVDINNVNKNLVLVFTDSPAKKDDQLIKQLKATALNRVSEIHVISTSEYADGESCLEQNDQDSYRDLTLSTGGFFIHNCGDKPSEVKDFVESFVATSQRLQISNRKIADDCSKEQLKFSVSDQTNHRVIFVESYEADNVDINLSAADASTGHVVQKVTKLGRVTVFKASKLSQTTYNVIISSSKSGKCHVQVGQESDFEVLFGYSVNPSFDNTNATAQFGAPLHPVVYVSSQLQSTVDVEFSVPEVNGYTEVGSLREEGCTYDYYFDHPFSCSESDKSFEAIVKVSTSDNVTIERSVLAYCNAPDTKCLHGGKEENGKCSCSPQYSGEFCENPICQNGGISAETVCNCLEGFKGEFCELTQCTKWNFLDSHDVQDFEHKTVSFVVYENQPDYNKILSEEIDQFVEGLGQTRTFKHFNLVTFNKNSATNVVNTISSRRFVDVFKKELQNSTSDDTAKVTQALLGVKLAAQASLYKPSIVYLITSKNTAIQSAIETLDALSEGGVQVNVILIDDNGSVDKFGNLQYFTHISYATSGRFIKLDKSNVRGLLKDYLHKIVYENALIEDKQTKDCTTQFSVDFPVESRNSWYSVVVSGTGARDNVELWNGQTKADINSYVKIKDQNSIVAIIPKSSYSPGPKTLKVKTTSGKCSVQIRSSSELHTDLGFTINPHNDFPNERPSFLGSKNHSTLITLKIGNALYKNHQVTPEKLTLISRDLNTVVDTQLNEASIGLRDPNRCAHQFITPLIAVPQGNYDLTKAPFLVKVNGKDENGNQFQRIKSYFPEKLDCKNGQFQEEHGYCQCDDNYYGDECQIPRCQHGGIIDLTVCNCPSGYFGKYCEKQID